MNKGNRERGTARLPHNNASCKGMLSKTENKKYPTGICENLFMLCLALTDPPKSPLKRGTLMLIPPFIRGVRGDRELISENLFMLGLTLTDPPKSPL